MVMHPHPQGMVLQTVVVGISTLVLLTVAYGLLLGLRPGTWFRSKGIAAAVLQLILFGPIWLFLVSQIPIMTKDVRVLILLTFSLSFAVTLYIGKAFSFPMKIIWISSILLPAAVAGSFLMLVAVKMVGLWPYPGYAP